MTLPEMREEKGRLANQANEILEKAKQDNRHDLRKEEEDKFDAIHADIDKLSAAIAREERQAATMASLESGGRRSEPNPIEQRGNRAGRTSDGKITEYDREEAFRAWALAGSDCELTERQQKDAQRCGVNLASKKMKLAMFAPVALKASNLRNPTEDDIRAWHRQMDEKRSGLRQDERVRPDRCAVDDDHRWLHGR
jgi:hypothetical protein